MDALFLAILLAMHGGGVERDERRELAIPANVTMHRSLRTEVEDMVAVSPTLRRQFAVIAGAPARVEIQVSPAQRRGSRRAETAITRYRFGFIEAMVSLPPGVDFVELLAHELEHIVEQIEGVDLAALARDGRATRDRTGIFETDRAHEAGRAAVRELAAAGVAGY